MKPTPIDRRAFVGQTVASGAAVALTPLATPTLVAQRPAEKPRRIKVGVIGCGSVSGVYLPQLRKCPYVELVSTCDIIPERARRRAQEFKVPNHYPHIDKMLAGEAFDLLVNLTDMQEHEHLNRQAIEAGKHIWSEKPIANSLAAGQAILASAKSRGVRIWGAPAVVQSPQFAF